MVYDRGWKSPFVGYCSRGPARGQYILLARIDDPTSNAEVWELEFSGAVESEGIFPGDAIAFDFHSEADIAFFDALGILPVPDPWADRVIVSLFADSKSRQALGQIDWDATGRFAGGDALATRFAMLRFEEGEHQPAASVEDASEVESWIHQTRHYWDAVSNLLSAAGLSLSLVRNDDSSHPESEGERWREFGGFSSMTDPG